MRDYIRSSRSQTLTFIGHPLREHRGIGPRLYWIAYYLKMLSRLVLVLLLGSARGGGVTKDDDLSKYWLKDIKAVGQLYGKTSDKDLYGVTLPPAMIYNVATTKRKEIFLEDTGQFPVSGFDQAGSTYPYNYNQINYKQSSKPAVAVNYFSYSESNANQNNDQQINKYLNPIPQRGKPNIDLSTKVNLQGFKPYFTGSSNGQDDYTSTSIRNILSTERSEITGAGEVSPQDNRLYRKNKARSKVRQFKGNTFDSSIKCRSRICTKKSKTSNRIYLRPVKKIKRIVLY